MTTEKRAFSKEEFVTVLMRLAWTPAEKTRGSLKEQIKACKLLASFGHEPAFKRLNEIANTDPAMTNGRRRDQEAAAKLLKTLLGAVDVDHTGIQ